MAAHTQQSFKDVGEQPTPQDLPAFLPYACVQLQAPFELRVLVELQDVYVSKTAVEKSKKAKSAKSAQQYTSRDSPQKVEESEDDAPRLAPEASDTVVALVAAYDPAERLVELALQRARAVPRLLLKIIALCLPFHPALNKFTVRWGPLDGAGLYEIAKMLPLSQITEICLDDSPVPECNQYLLLEEPTHLRSLSLARCQLEDRDVERLAARLRPPLPAARSLRMLALAGNRLGDAGAAALAAALRTNRTLQYLNLCGNRLTDDGAARLLAPLMEFPLTHDELVAKRHRMLDYLKVRNELIRKCYGELEAAERSADESSRGGRRRAPTSARGRRPSAEGRATGTSDALAPRALAMAAELLGPHSDPFAADETVVRDGHVYSLGNTALCALNLAYNELGWATLVRLRAVLAHQGRLPRRAGPGLLRALLEGNALPAAGPDLAAVQDLLERAVSARAAKPLKPKPDRLSGKAKSK